MRQERSYFGTRDLSVELNSKRILTSLSFEAPLFGLHGLIGPSGDGKSVFLKTLSGIFAASAGQLLHIPETKSLMFQEGALFDSLSVFDNVAFPIVGGNVPTARLHKSERLRLRETVLAILARVGLDWASHKMPGELSGGMRRRVSLARALVTRPDLILLDDPTSGLDPVASSVIMNLIVELRRETNCTMIVVSHDLRRLLPVCDQVLALFDGNISYNGGVDALGSAAPDEVVAFVSCRYDL